MNFTLQWTLFFLFSLISTTVSSADEKLEINITGNIREPTCKMDTVSPVNIDFGNINYDSGRYNIIASKDIKILLSDCPKRKKVVATLRSLYGARHAGSAQFKTEGTAKDIFISLRDNIENRYYTQNDEINVSRNENDNIAEINLVAYVTFLLGTKHYGSFRTKLTITFSYN